MRRIGRYILSGLTVLSLVLCVSTGALWLRSLWLVDNALWLPGGTSNRGYGFESGLGVLTVQRLVLSRPLTAVQAGAGYTRQSVTPARRETFNQWLRDETWHGFGWQDYRTTMFSVERLNLYGHRNYISAPYWAIFLAAVAMPVTSLWRRRRRVAGKCAKCGYDLRATPDRCPECGTMPGRF
jgi:hypothetical protein